MSLPARREGSGRPGGVRRLAARLLAVLARLASVFAVAGAGVALAVALMVVVSVIGRAALGLPIPGDVELTQFGIALALSLGLPWCQAQRANIIVDFFTQRASRHTLRGLDGVGALLLALMCALLAWRSGAGAFAVHEAHESSMILALPMWWAYASLAPGLALAALLAVVQTWAGPAATTAHAAPAAACAKATPAGRATQRDPAP